MLRIGRDPQYCLDLFLLFGVPIVRLECLREEVPHQRIVWTELYALLQILNRFPRITTENPRRFEIKSSQAEVRAVTLVTLVDLQHGVHFGLDVVEAREIRDGD